MSYDHKPYGRELRRTSFKYGFVFPLPPRTERTSVVLRKREAMGRGLQPQGWSLRYDENNRKGPGEVEEK